MDPYRGRTWRQTKGSVRRTNRATRRAAEQAAVTPTVNAQPEALLGVPGHRIPERAADVVAYLDRDPSRADAVRQVEEARDGGPRKTVMDAVERAEKVLSAG
ncbi:MAG TPA: hypothetical protein VGB14_16320 [Acidimicrobiales bacterium]|jgi:hypothetical protein